ncbi:replication initiation protein [Brevirhabdus sp.]|uniref:replication initiation protein n=1 Tax=Brevirhabdus sp. TaxID=2004514 RepID=UPI004059600C
MSRKARSPSGEHSVARQQKITADIPQDKLTGALKRSSVRKNVAAIHVSGKLTLLQRKLSNVLLLNAYDTLVTRNRHSIDARTLCLMIGYNSNDMETLKQSLRSLAETLAEWDMLDDKGRQEWGVSALLSYAKLSGGVCEYAYSPALAEKLHDPKVFALINLNIQRRFTSGHALALYENCFRFVRTGSTGWWPIDLFRRLMGVDGSAYYESYKHLNAKIIKPAVAEVNKTSNIQLTPEVRKQGRAVSEIRFRIKENPQLAMFDIDDQEGVRQSGTYTRLVSLGVSDRLARQWIAEHGDDYVTEKLNYVAAQKDVESPVRYLSAALKQDFSSDSPPAAPPAPAALAAAAARRRAEEEAARPAQEREARIAAIRRARAARMERVREVVATRNPTQRDADKRLFLSGLDNDLDREDFARLGWGSALNARAIFAFWLDLVPGIFDDLPDEA